MIVRTGRTVSSGQRFRDSVLFWPRVIRYRGGPLKPWLEQFQADNLKQRLRLAALNRHFSRSVLILTIPKSGTNLLRLFLANYLMLYYQGAAEPITYRRMHDEIFPNEIGPLYYGREKLKKPGPVLALTPFRDILFGHLYQRIRQAPLKGRKVFGLYRNPLDNLVSMYFYLYKYRPETTDRYDHPRQIIDRHVTKFCGRLAWIREQAKAGGAFLPLAYETMFREPRPTFLMVLDFLGLPVDTALLDRAIEFSSIRQVKKEEDATGPIHAPANFTGRFARSGRIGQWREYFTDDDVARVRAILDAHGFSLDSFILD